MLHRSSACLLTRIRGAEAEDYVALRLTLRAHPVALLRDKLTPGWAAPASQVFAGTTRTIVSDGRDRDSRRD